MVEVPEAHRIAVLCAAGTSTLAATATPGSVADTDFQSWDELDLLTRLTPSLDVTWIGRMRLSEELPNPARYVFGTDWNFSLDKTWVVTPSWYYTTYRTASGSIAHRRTPILAVTPTVSFGSWSVSDRNRLGVRVEEHSWFYRNRLRVDYRTSGSRVMPSLFLWDEVFYFSQYGGWTRNRLAVGGQEVSGERFTTELYYQREDNKAGGEPRHINTVALVVEIRLR